MPTASYDTNLFYQAVGPLFGLLLCIGTLYPASRLIKAVVEEKEHRLEVAAMVLMGAVQVAMVLMGAVQVTMVLVGAMQVAMVLMGAVQVTMVIMGLKGWISCLSWTIVYLTIYCLVSIISVILLKSSMLPKSDPVLLFVYLFLFYASEVILHHPLFASRSYLSLCRL